MDLVRVTPIMWAEREAKGWADQVVSLVGPGVKLPDFGGIPHHVVRCDDVESVLDAYAPMYVDIAAALDFVSHDSKVLVHCEGGISRSTAFSLGVLVKRGMDVQSACDYVHDQRLNMSPNTLILSHCERYLHVNGFASRVRDIVSHFDQRLVLWCSDCQEDFYDGDNCSGKHFQD